jgi:4-hydroxy-3-methylbut-2-enyl diphosphate reductase
MSPPEILISEFAGYCWGVERALDLARDAAFNAKKPVCSFGPLIHNPEVIRQLEAQGLSVIEREEDARSGTVVVRSHGVEREVIERLQRRGLHVVDATCTFVKAAQEKAARLRESGYLVVILGEPAHPEVMGLRSYAGPDALVVENSDMLPGELSSKRVGVVVQTTQSQERLAALVGALASKVRELLVYNTICNATEQRQQSAQAVAASVDVVIVVGGRNSGNTTRLAEICRAVQPNTHHIELPDEIRKEWLEGCRRIGVTAGASTPPDQIEALVAHLKGVAS